MVLMARVPVATAQLEALLRKPARNAKGGDYDDQQEFQ